MVDYSLILREIERIRSMPDWTGGEFSKGYNAALNDVKESIEAMSQGKSVWKEPTK
jgi:hypothetical protein